MGDRRRGAGNECSSYQLTVLSYRGGMRQRGIVALHDSERASQRRGYSRRRMQSDREDNFARGSGFTVDDDTP